jgi:hypothetical protein
MRRRLLLPTATVFGSLLLIATNVVAQERSLEELLPGLKERAVVLDIIARVVEKDQKEVWNSVNSKVTIPGRPVGLKLVGANLVVVVQFTPYLQPHGTNHLLVAQVQIWVDVPKEGIRYQTTMQTIPLEFGEEIYFFPLGSVNPKEDAYIEIQLALHPYSGPAETSNSPLAEPAPPSSHSEDESTP